MKPKIVVRFSKWVLSTPFRAFVGLFVTTVFVYSIWQLTFHTYAYLTDPWGTGGLKSATVFFAFSSLGFAVYVWKKSKDTTSEH